MQQKSKSPWAWIPSLYLAQGLPYVAVMTISVIMYKRLGISNTDIALYTSWLYLPWVIKPFWSPFVDLLKTKRWWIVTMQLLIGAGFAGIAFSIPLPFFFQATLAFFWLLAFSSATHDIAADGFYMIALDSHDQAKFVGIRSTFYRVATIMGQGLLIILAGVLESVTGSEPVKLIVQTVPGIETSFKLPESVQTNVADSKEEIHFLTNSNKVEISLAKVDNDSVKQFLAQIAELNKVNGFIHTDDLKTGINGKLQTESWWTTHISSPLGHWIKTNFGEKREIITSNTVGSLGVAAISLSKQPAEGDEIVLNTTMNSGDASISMVLGERLVFNAENWNKPAYIAFQADSKLDTSVTAEYKGLSGNIPFAWSVTFFVLAGLFLCFSFYHRVALPKSDKDKPTPNVTAKSLINDFLHTFKTFFSKPQLGVAIFFMLTYRFSEAQALKLINPFLLDSRDIGGLGLTTGEVGLVYGTIGIIGLTLGGIIGGFAAAKGGLKKWLWPMTLSMLLTIGTFVYLSFSQTESLILINICIFIEQFGYGFGFTAYMLYLMYFSEGEHKTAHYAICTGFMALGMMLPGMFAGWLQELLGYNHFFVWVMICSVVPVIAVALLKINPNYGKASENEVEE